MEKTISKELILISIVAVIAVVGVVGITKISSTPKELLIEEYISSEPGEVVGQAFNTCAYYQNRYDYYSNLASANEKYNELSQTYSRLLELYC